MKRLVIILVAFVVLHLHAVSAEDYLIGAYSQYQLRYTYGSTAQVMNTLGSLLHQGGFNATHFAVNEDADYSSVKLGAALSALNENSIRTILYDQRWTSSKVGTTAITYGNVKKMEAEYELKYDPETHAFIPDVLPSNDTTANDEYNYVFKHETGMLSGFNISNNSDGYSWVCNELSNHTAGLALSYPRFRWKPNDKQNPRIFGYDFKFRQAALAGNRLYLTVAMKFSGGVPAGPVAEIKLKVLKNSTLPTSVWNDYADTLYYEFVLHPVNPSAYSTTIYNQQYSTLLPDAYGNYLFEYYIELPEYNTTLYNQVMMGEYFYHINPQVFWFGFGKMEIDYIQLEDEYHRSLRLDPSPSNPYLIRLQNQFNQISNLDTSNNIIAYYAKDEPLQGQFSMYHKIESFMDGCDKQLVTAINLEDWTSVKPSGNPNYSHYNHFLRVANPHKIMMDAYPLQEWTSSPNYVTNWDNESYETFVQNKLQTRLLNHYLSVASEVKHNPQYYGTELLFSPQIFGEWVPSASGSVSYWRYMMPPRSMVKCLQLLPLCYAADGIVSFAITSEPHYNYGNVSNPYYRVTPLKTQHGSSSYDGLTVLPNSSAFSMLTDANEKIAVYGHLIKGFSWVSADSLMVNGSHPDVNIDAMLLNDLTVVHSTDVGYEGYVQCGYYQNSSLNPQFMIVNRRSVFKNSGVGNVIPEIVDNCFCDADSQVVNFTPNTEAYSTFGTYVGLFDPYDNTVYYPSNDSIKVTIGPGDGKLLQMISTLPDTVNTAVRIFTKGILEGDITIASGGSVSV
ncbi:MAG: hypothetical protein PHY48_06145, partial [Candidatus Cloacimonetes bacterium]|nr:hypothetical protein [Candidatus Cloacimonadota bacterium]